MFPISVGVQRLYLFFSGDHSRPEAVCSPAGWKECVPDEQEQSCGGLGVVDGALRDGLTWTPAESSRPNKEQSVTQAGCPGTLQPFWFIDSAEGNRGQDIRYICPIYCTANLVPA